MNNTVLTDFIHIITLRDYNTMVVTAGTVILGIASGVMGTFTLLRKRALLSDAVSHATLPGIAGAFLLMTYWQGNGKFLPGLLLGALFTGLLGGGSVLLIRQSTRLKEDTALGIVLSVFFGLGIVLLGFIQNLAHGHAAGLKTFIYGKTAAMLWSDMILIVTIATVLLGLVLLFFKEFLLLCFDPEFSSSQGIPVMLLDMTMITLLVLVTVIGLQAVGLILMIALLITPAAAARFWSNTFFTIILIAAGIGAISGFAGSLCSALFPMLPAGAMIVIVAAFCFVFSMILGKARGLLWQWIEHWKLERKIQRQHLLRALYEGLEAQYEEKSEVLKSSVMPWKTLLKVRSWTPRGLRSLLNKAKKQGLLYESSSTAIALTEKGLSEAKQVVRNHRLWELYLIYHADIAPSHVDRNADSIEHVLPDIMVKELERLLATKYPRMEMPISPHSLQEATEH